jgi:hypothetical protein
MVKKFPIRPKGQNTVFVVSWWSDEGDFMNNRYPAPYTVKQYFILNNFFTRKVS